MLVHAADATRVQPLSQICVLQAVYCFYAVYLSTATGSPTTSSIRGSVIRKKSAYTKNEYDLRDECWSG